MRMKIFPMEDNAKQEYNYSVDNIKSRADISKECDKCEIVKRLEDYINGFYDDAYFMRYIKFCLDNLDSDMTDAELLATFLKESHG